MERAWHIERVNSNPFPRRFNVAPTTAIPLMCQDTEPIFIGGNRLLSDVFGFAWTGSGGEWGIRTPEPSRANGFQDRRIRPLCQLSGGSPLCQAQTLVEISHCRPHISATGPQVLETWGGFGSLMRKEGSITMELKPIRTGDPVISR